MKSILVLCALIGLTLSAPATIDDPQNAQILKYDSENIGIDGYNFAFETSDGTSRQESGQLKNIGTENEALSVQGTVTWVGDDGQTYKLNYVADETGFHPEGVHLPH